MKRWQYILAFLIAPLGTPVTFAVFSGLAYEPRSFSGIISTVQSFVILTAPAAYIITLLIGMPAVLMLSRKKWLTFPAIIFIGSLVGSIAGLMAGYYISGYDMIGMIEYWSLDIYSIYAPAAISGIVCSITYWIMYVCFLQGKRSD